MSKTTGLLKTLRLYRGYFYMATPYSKHPRGKDAAYSEAMEYLAAFTKNLIVCYSPIVHCHEMAKKYNLPTDHTFWTEYNARMMEASCGGLFILMEGHNESEGMKQEREFYKIISKPSFDFTIGVDEDLEWL